MKALWSRKYKKLIKSGNISAAKELILSRIPKEMTVYKYFRGTNRDWNSITKPELWLCRTSDLNDPFDSAFLVNCRSKEVYNCDTEREAAIREFKEQHKHDNISKKLQNSVFVSCFSEKCDSLLMWGHYSAEHMGICVGYNLRELIEKYNCFPVLYSKKMPNNKNIKEDNLNSLYESILTKSND